MEALILAAGRGERMRPLSDRIPKPLLHAGGTSLIERHVSRLAEAGHRRLVVNLAHLGEQIQETLGDGEHLGASITYSREPPGALETAGGIVQALRYLRGDRFAVINGDIWTDFPFAGLDAAAHSPAWLVLVDNPPEHEQGDFCLRGGRMQMPGGGDPTLTFAGIAVYQRTLFEKLPPGRRPLRPVLTAAVERGEVCGTHYRGEWTDVGTPDRLDRLRGRLAAD